MRQAARCDEQGREADGEGWCQERSAPGIPWQTPNAFDEPRAQPRQFMNRYTCRCIAGCSSVAPLTKEQIANRVRQQLDMLTSLAATEAGEHKRESKDSMTRRERSRKPGEREIIRSASVSPFKCLRVMYAAEWQREKLKQRRG